MIICNIKGGIGNQLFQYACARAIAEHLGAEIKIDIADATKHNLLSETPRRISICDLNISAKIANPDEVGQLRYRYGFLSYVYERIETKFFSNETLNFDTELLDSIKKNHYLDGYFQSYKYFSDIRSILLHELTPKCPSSTFLNWKDKIAKIPNPVSVHIRRGDYVSNKNTYKEFGPCPIDYFERAISYFDKKMQKFSYVVFSDDIEWVRENLKVSSETDLICIQDKQLTDIEELLLMSTCSHNIISNSSFSWWGAWLNQNPDKIVIAPTPWLDNGKINEDDLIPPTWTRIEKYTSRNND